MGEDTSFHAAIVVEIGKAIVEEMGKRYSGSVTDILGVFLTIMGPS